MHPIVTNINKRGRKKKARYMRIEHIFCTKELYEIKEIKRRDKVISTENSFSYENISIKFSMYQVHTKSIKVCRISNMIQYKEIEEKNNILLYYKVS